MSTGTGPVTGQTADQATGAVTEGVRGAGGEAQAEASPARAARTGI
jgi:hypothetical protein